MKPQLSLVSSSKSLAFLALASASVSHRSIINEDVVDGSNGTPAVVIEQSKYNEHQGNLRMKSSDSPPSSSYSNTEITRNISSNNKNDKTENTNIKLSKRQTPRYLQSSSSSSAPGCGGNSGTTHSVYLGCYDDEAKDRAMPFELYEGYSSAKRLGHAALDCERECSNLGYRYFAREFRGQCFCGNSPAEYSKHGLDTGCNCCAENVGPGKMCVWEVSRQYTCFVGRHFFINGLKHGFLYN